MFSNWKQEKRKKVVNWEIVCIWCLLSLKEKHCLNSVIAVVWEIKYGFPSIVVESWHLTKFIQFWVPAFWFDIFVGWLLVVFGLKKKKKFFMGLKDDIFLIFCRKLYQVSNHQFFQVVTDLWGPAAFPLEVAWCSGWVWTMPVMDFAHFIGAARGISHGLTTNCRSLEYLCGWFSLFSEVPRSTK